MAEGDEDEDRRSILARRARFVMAAMSGLSLAVSCTEPEPQPCLDAPPPPGTGGSGGMGPVDGGGGMGGFGGFGEGGLTP
jgi:hypothetical protein